MTRQPSEANGGESPAFEDERRSGTDRRGGRDRRGPHPSAPSSARADASPSPTGATGGTSVQTHINLDVWSHGDFVKQYASRNVYPNEMVVLLRHAQAFAGNVLELGCGAGRLTGHLIEVAERVDAIDVSERMLAYCEAVYPGGHFQRLDLRDLSGFPDTAYDAVLGAACVLDVLGDAERRATLREIARVLKPGGLLVMSSHNRAFIPRLMRPTDIAGARNAVRMLGRAVLVPWRERNHRRLRALERHEPEYALVNDNAHDFRLVHYYVTRDAQERQFEREGFELIECIDDAGHVVSRGEAADGSLDLYYVARPTA